MNASVFMLIVLSGVLTSTFYMIGLHDGRIYECRRSFKTVTEAPVVWDQCKERLGRSWLR